MTTIHVTPLLEIQSAEFATWYEHGTWWAMHGERDGEGPLPDSYLVENLRTYEEHHLFEHQQWLDHIGFYLGMIHGAVLSPQTGQLRPNVTTLVQIQHSQFKRGYRVGREAYFHEAETPGAYRHTERSVIDWLKELVLDNPYQEDESHPPTWYYIVGDLLGELSGHLFPETEAERQHWQQEEERYQRREAARARQQAQPEQQQDTDLVSVQG